ncbi:unnamed protein product [Haemonchus placei]|uniref:Uncharacterized protein n=1 Tax=Haemonchus placei TaxID=6290 RepID=A0A0N4X3K6_HAEPC|nr:unnamed protein product [Haemonchus placei]
MSSPSPIVECIQIIHSKRDRRHKRSDWLAADVFQPSDDLIDVDQLDSSPASASRFFPQLGRKRLLNVTVDCRRKLMKTRKTCPETTIIPASSSSGTAAMSEVMNKKEAVVFSLLWEMDEDELRSRENTIFTTTREFQMFQTCLWSH